jgi:hypothetical protein
MGWAAVFIGGAAALAEIPWHASLSAARAASTVSHKPVLVIFTASWSPESNRFQQQALASPEVEALIAACFEPVHVDVDVAPGVTKRLNVSHVPSAYVVGETDVPLSMFECPEVPAEFVAAVARAAQLDHRREVGLGAARCLPRTLLEELDRLLRKLQQLHELNRWIKLWETCRNRLLSGQLQPIGNAPSLRRLTRVRIVGSRTPAAPSIDEPTTDHANLEIVLELHDYAIREVWLCGRLDLDLDRRRWCRDALDG